MKDNQIHRCCLCGSGKNSTIGEYSTPSLGEISFALETYHRTIRQCMNCGVYYNDEDYGFDDLYEKNYNEITYRNDLKDAYDRIMNLPEGKSDNRFRVQRIVDFLQENGFDRSAEILDIGSGLSVFAGEFLKHDYSNIYTVDPSPLSTAHAKEYVGVSKAVCGEISSWPVEDKVDLVTFNKVLEHIRQPLPVLQHAKTLLKKNGFIYIELPDGQHALENGDAWRREEFWVGHYTVFTLDSMRFLAKEAGLVVREIKALHEPSDKYTAYMFCQPQ